MNVLKVMSFALWVCVGGCVVKERTVRPPPHEEKRHDHHDDHDRHHNDKGHDHDHHDHDDKDHH